MGNLVIFKTSLFTKCGKFLHVESTRHKRPESYRRRIKEIAIQSIRREFNPCSWFQTLVSCPCRLLGLEKKNGAVAQVEVDEVLGLCKGGHSEYWVLCIGIGVHGKQTVGNKAAKVSSNHTVPSSTLP